ncbi:UNVERIFIED_CONTAM: hypothetical protein Sradi_6112700 [Sesamum radiatum]|uniref:Uncharacterized protein n=1 Tax=Sesamum radiatum TaxID=300843 RepID=A0AAW2KKV6_SESRA
MSSDSRSLQFVGESVGEGEDAFEVTSRGLGPNPTAPESGRRRSLRQAAHRFLHESLGEDEDEWEEGSFQDGEVLRTEERRAPPGTGGRCPSRSDWVLCYGGIRYSFGFHDFYPCP